MNHLTSSAPAAAARTLRANPGCDAPPGMGSITQQPSFRPVLRRDIMAAVNTCARDLGLRPGTVVVLDALLSCLPCASADGQDARVTPATLLTVYASNETLCFRAKGVTDRQLRRNLDALETAGLLQRRDSANGKRFPILRGGKVVGAFGLDLSPLFARADDLLARALRCREEADELRGLRAQILQMRAACLAMEPDHSTLGFLDSLRNLLRRATLTVIEARAILNHLTTVMSGRDRATQIDRSVTASSQPTPNPSLAEAEETTKAHLHQNPVATCPQHDDSLPVSHQDADHLTVSDGQDVRHKEPESDTKNQESVRDQPNGSWYDLTTLSGFYAEPRTARDYVRIAFEFGTMLRIDRDLLTRAAAKLGLWQLLRLEDRMAKSADKIVNTSAYLRSVIAT